MRKYVKPLIIEEVVELEDIIAVSPGGSIDVETEEGTDIDDIFGGITS